MLLKTINRTENRDVYPTIFMIMNVLAANLCKATFYFQYDSLWKNNKIISYEEQAHDVCDQKRVRLKRAKSCPLFSIGYPERKRPNVGRACLETHDVHGGQRLTTNWYFLAISYLIENNQRSSLASKMNNLRTHDVYEAKWFNPTFGLSIYGSHGDIVASM
jgi:hypothetical protein